MGGQVQGQGRRPRRYVLIFARPFSARSPVLTRISIFISHAYASAAITHSLLDLFIHHLSESPLSLSTHHNHQPSPSSPSDFAPPSTSNNPTASTSQLCTAFSPTLQISDLTQIKISLHAQSAQREGGGEDRAGREIGRKEDPSRGYSLPKGPGAGKTRQKDVWGADVSGKKGNEEGEATRFLFE